MYIRGVEWTCANAAESKSTSDCERTMQDLRDMYGAVLGNGVTQDMYLKDLCPVTYKDMCTTCATTRNIFVYHELLA